MTHRWLALTALVLGACSGDGSGTPTSSTYPTGYTPIGTWHVDSISFFVVDLGDTADTGDNVTDYTSYGYPYSYGTVSDDLYIVIKADNTWFTQINREYTAGPTQTYTDSVNLTWEQTAERETTLTLASGDTLVCLAPASDDALLCDLFSKATGEKYETYALSR